ncbi:ArnT family glycosyltransferase [Erythrobacter crassostreae]|uniref:Uncharacterized protein n=1 Tax=Erythrobacter crassostreae TaxID=2828328 RepID=A0A9X1JKV3_9SPHN|nr:hypothetical protein [Erythrobacter crassostrea]MBV7259480.1 hypothetical protein [Erythrobacter crassostrea]
MPAAATTAETPVRPGFSLPAASSAVWLYALIGVLAAMHLSMVFGRSINWDEFWFYSQVEVVARGEFIQPLQTIHTRFFAWWLPAMPGNSIDHIIIARMFMFACLVVTSAGIFLTAQKFASRRTAIIAVAAYLGAGFVLQHGTAFRVDPIVAAFLTTGFAIAALTRLRLLAIVALGVVIGIAAMVTIKFVLWAPAFAGLALYRWEEESFDWRYPLRWIAAGAIALATFAILYTLHSSEFADQAREAAAGTLGRSSSGMLGLASSPHLSAAGKALFTALPLAIAIVIAPWVIARDTMSWQRKVALAAMWLPVLTPLVYRNSLPYFYPFILPPVVIVTVWAFRMIAQRYSEALIAAVIAGSALMIWAVDARGVTERQQVLVNGVHQTFEKPVNYFDCCGMIATFPKQNTFRTGFGVERYLAAGEPTLLQTMRETPVPFLLDNNREFSKAILGTDSSTFHPDDADALASTYVRFWGDIFLAGKQLRAGETKEWDVLVPGPYSVTGTLVIDGREWSDGSVVTLDRGSYTLENPSGGDAGLMWGEGYTPSEMTPPDAYWTAF